MNISRLEMESLVALKNKDTFRRNVISQMVAQIKRAAIDKGCRDNITEDFVDAEILKIQKQMADTLSTCPANRTDLLEKYQAEEKIIAEFAPQVISDPDEIKEIVVFSGLALDKKNMGAIMKFLKSEYNGKMDMGAASKVLKDLLN
ncbi:MAG: GatB/YqeY domain-containing protein [Lachnospiraceae bacterium]|nr:GatB/YqeY domain-containing protein [Lachnospiraceae bacterium]